MRKTALVLLIAALVASASANAYLIRQAGSCNVVVLHKADVHDEQCFSFRTRFDVASRDLLNPRMQHVGFESYKELVSFWSIDSAHRCGVSVSRQGEGVCINSADFACLSRLAAGAAAEIVADGNAP